MTGQRIGLISATMGMAIAVAGCGAGRIYEPHIVDKHSKAGAFTVAATMIETWDNFVGDLSPAFELKKDQALDKAIPRGAITEKQMLDALSAALKVAPPTSATTSTVTETLATDGSTETTGTKEKATGVGDLAAAEPPDEPQAKLQRQAGTKLPPKTGQPDIDPFLRFTAATALFQEVKLLNKTVSAAARRHNMAPYILRLQMNNVPFARHQPYDTYAMLSLFAREVCKKSDGDAACRGVRNGDRSVGWKDRSAVVVPLLVTDNLESLLSSRSTNVVRQIALAASILQSGFASSLGLTRKTEELNAVLGNDLNSLMTVGRPASSSLYVRLGAMLEATAEYAMVPRNYSVTLLVLVPEDSTQGNDIQPGDVEGIRVTGSVVYRDAKTGDQLPRDPRSSRQAIVREVIADLTGETRTVSRRRSDDLMKAIYVNDYNWFSDILIKDYGGDDPISIGAPADLWNALLERNVSTGYFGTEVHLPKYPITLPPDQTFVLVDDGSTTMTGMLTGARRLSGQTIQPRLVVALADGGAITLVAPTIESVTADQVKIVFPSLAVHQLRPKTRDGAPAFLPGKPLTLTPIASGSYVRKSSLAPMAYEVAYFVRPPDAPSSGAGASSGQ